ncbi:hypothetical protein [Arthrobacter sp. UYCu723]
MLSATFPRSGPRPPRQRRWPSKNSGKIPERCPQVRPVFSTAPDDGRKYVQHRLWADRADVVELVKQGATVYVCGDGKHMAPEVRDTCALIYREATGASAADADAWMDEVERTHGRYVADIFT